MSDLRICIDRDCPSCGWPELVAVGDMAKVSAGPSRLECYKCHWQAPVIEEDGA